MLTQDQIDGWDDEDIISEMQGTELYILDKRGYKFVDPEEKEKVEEAEADFTLLWKEYWKRLDAIQKEWG